MQGATLDFEGCPAGTSRISAIPSPHHAPPLDRTAFVASPPTDLGDRSCLSAGGRSTAWIIPRLPSRAWRAACSWADSRSAASPAPFATAALESVSPIMVYRLCSRATSTPPGGAVTKGQRSVWRVPKVFGVSDRPRGSTTGALERAERSKRLHSRTAKLMLLGAAIVVAMTAALHPFALSQRAKASNALASDKQNVKEDAHRQVYKRSNWIRLQALPLINYA